MLAYKKQQALEALLVCGTRKEAAMMAGITEKTLRQYAKDAELQGSLQGQDGRRNPPKSGETVNSHEDFL